MPPRKSPVLLPSTLQVHATQKQRMESLENRMEGLIQWHQDLGDRVENLEKGFKEVREDLSKLSNQLTTAADKSQLLLNNINICLVGSTAVGLERPGLVSDVREISRKQDSQGELLLANSDRLKSLERTRATIIMVGGTISTALTGLGFWIWSHTDQLLATISDVYGKPKTEVSSPASAAGR